MSQNVMIVLFAALLALPECGGEPAPDTGGECQPGQPCDTEERSWSLTAIVYPAYWGCADPDGVVIFQSCCVVLGAEPVCALAKQPEELHMFEDQCRDAGSSPTRCWAWAAWPRFHRSRTAK